MARRRSKLTKQEARGLLALIAGLVLLFAKIIEYLFKAVEGGIRYVSNDVSWARERVKDYHGGWGEFYDTELHHKIFNYLAGIFAIIGLLLLPDRLIAGCLFLTVAAVSFLLRKILFSGIGKWAKEIMVVALVSAGLTSNGVYQHSEEVTIQQEQEEQALRIKKQVAYEKEQVIKLDSSNKLVDLGRKELLSKNYQKADLFLKNALTVAPSNDNALYQRAVYLKETKKLDKAISLFSQVHSSSDKYDESLVNQGLCLINKGEKAQAVHLFKEASVLNNKQALKLYDKYNPIRKQITGYFTECYDGTSSNATGRGACSHHGGVRNWNKPIFSESRKYE